LINLERNDQNFLITPDYDQIDTLHDIGVRSEKNLALGISHGPADATVQPMSGVTAKLNSRRIMVSINSSGIPSDMYDKLALNITTSSETTDEITGEVTSRTTPSRIPVVLTTVAVADPNNTVVVIDDGPTLAGTWNGIKVYATDSDGFAISKDVSAAGQVGCRPPKHKHNFAAC
jgi:hypothetical protein